MSGANRHPGQFWATFCAARASIEARLAAAAPARGPISFAVMRAYFGDLVAALSTYDPALTPELERDGDAGWRLVVSADGAVESFAAAHELVDAGPATPGWRVCALRPRRAPPARVEAGAASLDLARLRFAYGLANDRMVALALTEDPMPADRFEAQFLARRLVADLLGEEDYASWIADTRIVAYEDWLAVTPGGRSWPLAELPARFDAIFHPAPVRARPVEMAPLPIEEDELALCA